MTSVSSGFVMLEEYNISKHIFRSLSTTTKMLLEYICVLNTFW